MKNIPVGVTEDKSTILIVSNFFVANQAGWGPHLDIAQALNERGWRVIKTSWYRQRVIRLVDMLWTAWYHRHHYSVAQVDVYSGPAFMWAETVCKLLTLLGKPFILTLHGGNLPDFAQKYSERVRNLLQSATYVTAPSAYLIEKMQVYRTDLILLPNPVELDHYPYRLRETTKPALCWLRTFRYIYNPQMAIRALAQLVEDFPDVVLTMIGHDSGDGTLQDVVRLAEEFNVTDNLKIIKGVSKRDVPSWLSKSDVFINTALFDNTPVSVIEAQACGLCLISTRVGGLPYMLEDKINVLFVPPEDNKALVAAIRKVLTDNQVSSMLSENGHQNAIKYDLSAVIAQWEDLYNQVFESPVNT